MKKLFLLIAFILLFVQINLTAQVTVTGASGTAGPYSTLKLAFDAINLVNQTGNNIVITITASTTETATAQLTGANGMWTTLKIYPTSSGLSISGSFTGAIIDLNGADKVTIDGRVNQTGDKDLIIQHTSNGSNDNHTIRFINSAENNTIQYCIVKGCCPNFGAGVIFFSTSGAGNGNSNNTISNNDITGTSDLAAGRSYNAIYSAGSMGFVNSHNVISNNNFYNHHLLIGSSYGISISTYSTDFTISGNSFYETTNLGLTATTAIYSIYINVGTGNGYVNITGNFLGGKERECGGGAFTMTDDGIAARNLLYAGIYIATSGTTTKSNIVNNTIRNIEILRTTNTNPFRGIYSSNGTSMGNVNGNIIGNSTETGSIKIVASGTSVLNSYGLDIGLRNSGTAETHDIKNNIIGSITLSNYTGLTNARPYFTGIRTQGGLANTNVYIEDNLIGSTSTANSINNSTAHNGNSQSLVAMDLPATVAINYFVKNNTIANLNNNTVGTNQLDRVFGINATGSGNFEISGNTVRNLTCATAATGSSSSVPIAGIFHTATGTSKQDIFGNTVYNIESKHTTAMVNVNGIYFSGPTLASTSNIYNNFVHSLNSGHTGANSRFCSLIGVEINCETAGDGASVIRNVYNNVVSLGTNVTYKPMIKCISEHSSGGNYNRTNNIYFNTLYIGGTASDHDNTIGEVACLYVAGAGTNTVKNIRNNIMMNARTATGASNDFFCITLGGNLGATTINYNDYYFSGTGGALARMNTPTTASHTTLAGWQTELNGRAGVSGKDANSKNLDPQFILTLDAGGTAPEDYRSTNNSLKGSGVTIAGFDKDFSGFTRPNPPSLGGIENDNPLPVKLAAFNANVNKRDVKLSWITESEENNSGFEVERAEVGSQNSEFRKISFVRGNGTKNSPTNYSFEDKKLNTGKYNYRLKQIDYNGNYEYFNLGGDVEVGVPGKYNLSQNYPNPFNPLTKIDFDLPADGKVSIKVFDITGREVMNLLKGFKTAGYYTLTMNAGVLSSGVYFYRFTAENNKFVMTKKMVIIK